jgi:hypothetical protein
MSVGKNNTIKIRVVIVALLLSYDCQLSVGRENARDRIDSEA